LPAPALGPGAAQVQIGDGQGARFGNPHRAPGIQENPGTQREWALGGRRLGRPAWGVGVHGSLGESAASIGDPAP
jgi:hypothetical protein